MSGLTPFPPPTGLASLGTDDAGTCVDGVCSVPDTVEQAGPGEAEEAELPR